MHPVIFLWSHPRSLSTATERIMRERGDLHCLHEPFLRYYYLHRTDKRLAHFDGDDNNPKTYEGVRDMVLKLARKRPVFAKDMSYYVMPELLDDVEFCSRIRHCFLIRDPRKSLLSYYRLDPQFSNEETGIKAQWQHYRGIEKLGLETPLVLEAESIQADTKSVIRRFWALLGLDYIEEAFAWSSETTPQDWQYVAGWHRQVGGSSGIRSVTAEDEQKAIADFEAVSTKAPQLKQYYETHLPSYMALKERSLRVPTGS